MSTSFPARFRALSATWSSTGEAREQTAPRPPSSCDDIDLMLSIQEKDRDALGILFDRYSEMVLHIGLQVLRDRGEAEELVQEVFLSVCRKCGSFDRNKGSVRGWLRRVTYGVAFDRKQYLNNRHFYSSCALDDEFGDVKSQCDVEQETDERRLESMLRKTMESMSEKQRRTLELCFFEGYTLREISELER